jgi:hypothetical protein
LGDHHPGGSGNGTIWLILIAGFIFLGAPWTWWAMLIAAVGALFSAAQILILLLAVR